MERIHPSFGDWYRAAKIAPDGELLKKRWEAVDNFEINQGYAVDLVRLFFGVGQVSEKFLNEFRTAFQKTDAAFPMKHNDVELRVLAGAELVDSIETYTASWGRYISLAIVCCSFRNARKTLVPDIVELAIRYLSEQSVARFKPVNEGKPADLGKTPQQQITEACEQGNIAGISAPLVVVMQELVRLRNGQSNMRQRIALQAEETDMLWWLFGEHSRDLGEHFGTLGIAPASLISGKELADLVTELPGPLAASTFLNRMLRVSKGEPDTKVKLKDAVNTIPFDLRSKWFSADRWSETVSDLCPVAQALKLSLTSPKKTAWLPAFAESTRLSENIEMLPSDLAFHMYLEALLQKSILHLKA